MGRNGDGAHLCRVASDGAAVLVRRSGGALSRGILISDGVFSGMVALVLSTQLVLSRIKVKGGETTSLEF